QRFTILGDWSRSKWAGSPKPPILIVPPRLSEGSGALTAGAPGATAAGLGGAVGCGVGAGPVGAGATWPHAASTDTALRPTHSLRSCGRVSLLIPAENTGEAVLARGSTGFSFSASRIPI